MSFKNLETNTFHKGWIAHYKNLGIPIPEGKLGCNPNGMASSNTLKFIKKYNSYFNFGAVYCCFDTL